MTSGSTYVRKIGEGRYEYGLVFRAKNFRKSPDRYDARGVEPSVAAAEKARAEMESANG